MKISALLNPPPMGKIAAALAYLDSLPDDEVISCAELAKASKSTFNYVRNNMPAHTEMAIRTTLAPCSTTTGGAKKRFFGNPRAIKKLNEQLAKR